MDTQRIIRLCRTAATVAGLAVGGATAVAALPVVAGASPIHAGGVSVAASPPLCTTGQLRGSLRNGQGAAGSIDYDLTFRNAGPSTCRIFGFPGVSYESAPQGHQVGAAAARSGSATRSITLPAGRSAAAPLAEVDPLNFPTKTCRLTTVAGLRVYPPDQTASLFIAQKMKACADTSLQQLTIEAFGA